MMHKASCTAIALLVFTSLDVRATRKDARGRDLVQYTTITDSSEQLEQTNPYAGVYVDPNLDLSGAPPGTEVNFKVTCNNEFRVKESSIGLSVKGTLHLEGIKENCQELMGDAVMYMNVNDVELDSIAFGDSVLFGMIDKDKNKKISRSEFHQLFAPLLPVLPIEPDQVTLELDLIFSAFDKDDNGEINQEEISSAMMYLKKLTDPVFLVSELADYLFTTLDEDSDDHITDEELKKIVLLLPPGGSGLVEWMKMAADKNKDTRLSKAEFDLVVDHVKEILKNPLSVLDLVTPEVVLAVLDEDDSESVSMQELLQLPKRLPFKLDEVKQEMMQAGLESFFTMGDQNTDKVLNLQEIGGLVAIIKGMLRNPPIPPPKNMCFGKDGDTLRVRVSGQELTLKIKKAETCDKDEKDEKDEKDGVPRSAGFAAVFSLMVARFIAF